MHFKNKKKSKRNADVDDLESFVIEEEKIEDDFEWTP